MTSTNMTEHLSQHMTQKGLTAASYGASITTSVGGVVSVNQLALYGGLLLALFTFVINWWYQARRDKREQKLNAEQRELTELQEQLVRVKLEKELIDDG